MDYIPHTPADERAMLEFIGLPALDALFQDIPEKYVLKRLLDLPPPLTELETAMAMKGLAERNQRPLMTLMGAGAYDHYIPAAVRHVLSRSEFYTAYTPYQAEISQGILQAIYEYQTMIAGLTGTAVANASMYDGASAMAEGAVLAARSLGRGKIAVARTVHPEYRRVIGTYGWANGLEIMDIPYVETGRVDGAAMARMVNGETAAVLVQSPNFFGVVEDLAPLVASAHSQGALVIAGFSDATSLGLLVPPGALGADMVAGEGQAFGNPLNFGGPYLGILAASASFLRKIPGRIAGGTVDREGNRGFVLTLQTREQHIRREKATSNICSNESLCALAAAVYLASVGKNLRDLAVLNVRKAAYFRSRATDKNGFEPLFCAPVYNEFALKCPDPRGINEALENEGIIGGYLLEKEYPELQGALLFCATETLTKNDIDRAVSIMHRAAG